MSAESEVRQASASFYAALNRVLNGDAEPMLELWSHSQDVSTMQPIGGRQLGWLDVRELWEQMANAGTGGQVTTSDLVVRVMGDVAYTLCTEYVDTTLAGHAIRADVRATNIYRREGGEWKLVHHHGDIARGTEEVARRLRG